MINSILQLLQQQQNPGMQLASGSSPYTDDIGVAPMDLNTVLARLNGQQEQSLGNPRILSGQTQEWLGAKKPTQGGLDQQILANRFKPQEQAPLNQQMMANREPVDYAQNFADIGQGTINSLAEGKLITGQDIANDRALTQAKTSLTGRGGNTAFAQRMEIIQSDPKMSKLPLGLQMQIATGKIGTNMMLDENGNQIDISGAAEALGNLAYTPAVRKQQAELEYAGPIAQQKANVEIGAAGPIAAQKAFGERQGTTGAALPSIEQNTAYSKKILEDLVTHPGLPYAQGVASYAPLIRGTDRADFEALRNQVGGTAFLQAFQALKGGGQISNIEGEKATQAITRIMDRSLSPPDFVKAANDLYNILDMGLKRSTGEAAGDFGQTFSPRDFDKQNFGSPLNAIDEELKRRGIQ